MLGATTIRSWPDPGDLHCGKAMRPGGVSLGTGALRPTG